jgi:hypothetical protein
MASLQACAQEYLLFEPLPVASTLICFHWTSFLSQALWAAGLESWMGFGKLQATERHNAQKPLNTRCVVGGRRGLLRLVSSCISLASRWSENHSSRLSSFEMTLHADYSTPNSQGLLLPVTSLLKAHRSSNFLKSTLQTPAARTARVQDCRFTALSVALREHQPVGHNYLCRQHSTKRETLKLVDCNA